MIKNPEKVRKFENEFSARQKVDFKKNLKTYEAMHKLAVKLGALPLKNPLEGIENKIRVARILNSV